MLEISYEFMMRLYGKFKAEDEPALKDEWRGNSMEETYAAIFEGMVDGLFGEASKLENERFRKLMEKEYASYLQPHMLRSKVYEKVVKT